MNPQYGFFFDQSRCFGCHACESACRSWHKLPPGPLKYLRIYEYEKGSFPETRIHFQWLPCYHCEKPPCLDACPSGAIRKEPKYGAVLIDSAKCDGCRLCYEACPYGAPVFATEQPQARAQKCDMCLDRLEAGNLPICVLACPTRSLDFGRLDELHKKWGHFGDLQDLPDSRMTMPAVIFKPHNPKRRLVAYNTEKALGLIMKREPLPPLFSSLSDAVAIPEGTIGRDRLVIKHDSAEDLMRRTRSDEG